MIEYVGYDLTRELRDGLEAPSEEAAQRFLKDQFRPFKHALLSNFRSAPETLQILSRYATFHEQEQGVPPRRAVICADVIRDAALIRGHTYALWAYEQGYPLDFAAWFDVAQGAAGAMEMILFAEEQIRDPYRLIRDITDVICALATNNKPLTTQVEEFLFAYKKSSEAGRLLEASPSGILVIDQYRQEIEAHLKGGESSADILLNQSAICIAAGADLGSKLYRRVYRMSKPLGLPD